MENRLHLSLRADLTAEVVRELKEGKPLEIRFLDASCRMVCRDTIEYDAREMPVCRKTFDPAGAVLETEEWQRDREGRLLSHCLRRADDSLVYLEKWTRNVEGGLIKAEAWHYDERGRETGHKKVSGKRLISPAASGRTARNTPAVKALCFAMGALCLFIGGNFFLAGKAGWALAMGLAGAFNLYNAFKKR